MNIKRRLLTTKSDPEYFMRLPNELLDEIKKLANKEHRSINMQLIMMLADQLSALENSALTEPPYLNSDELMKKIFSTKGKEIRF